MSNMTIARRYAKALFDIGFEQNKSGQFGSDLESVLDTINGNEELKNMVSSHFVSVTNKKHVITETFSSIDPMVLNFICLVFDKNRDEYLSEIVAAYQTYLDGSLNITHAMIKSAVKLSDVQVSNIEQKFSALTGKTIKADIIVDESLIGGVVVNVGDKVYDGTIVRQLEIMKESLNETQLSR